MTSPHKQQWQSKVVPARLAFLAIYNPTLGPTDETFRDQLVYWYSRKDDEARLANRKEGKSGGGNGKGREDELREEENEKLRQIGLAQGMVGFARTFSNGEPFDSAETEKSRIVLHELENGWWVLASIDLTRLPAAAPAQPTTSTVKKSTGSEDVKAGVEYSSREVSPPALLVQQLVQAHRVFLLHHGPALDELFVKLSRERFCSTLGRYWTRFAKSWDVLLHGNPSVEVFGGVKLAAGGELGFGVGEEEWGSGEREVLEDLTRRTEGLVDSVVARFGETAEEGDTLPWMGGGVDPAASDGVVYSGVGAISRPSVRSVAQWMQHVYAYGDYAYGVHDNPNRERRKRRRRNPPESDGIPNETRGSRQIDPTDLRQKVQVREASAQESPQLDPSLLPKDNRPQLHPRVASHDHAADKSTPQEAASNPGIPPPIVSAADQALDKATSDAERPSGPERTRSDDSGKTMGIPDQYMKYMTFGLSSLAKTYTQKQRPPLPQRRSSASSATLKPPDNDKRSKLANQDSGVTQKDGKLGLAQVDPMPDGEALKAKAAQQIRQENKGHFVIGLKGDLDVDADHDNDTMSDNSFQDNTFGSRVVLRTLQIEMAPTPKSYADEVDEELDRGELNAEPENSNTRDVSRVRVLVYARRPFLYTFLFEQRTPSLSYSSFYKTLHRKLAPIHRPLLSSTSRQVVAQRIEGAHASTPSKPGNAEPGSASASLQQNTLSSKGTGADAGPIFDLLFDPSRLTLHTSLPNIPEPGTPAAEGLASTPGSPAPWTRLEALNVHSQILSTLASTARSRGREVERSSKTARGWWVVYLRLPPSNASEDERPEASARPSRSSSTHEGGTDPSEPVSTVGLPSVTAPPPEDLHRVAFLVRHAAEPAAGQSKATVGSRAASGLWGALALGGRGGGEGAAGGAREGWGPGALAGGIGFDARGYVEGLLSLNR